ncbi:MAG TPA: prepilin-type N-terminal cleavage/methylation domain-containing protein [Leptolyngbyaceae cyanobacterium M65_K2018_010]|nr:prepilin-type N-terminal cleavage/methylation domain-containing protein [Leptolyngbyaceae cyanobacterium M65_K2018_010]
MSKPIPQWLAPRAASPAIAGFSLAEGTIVVVVIAILAALAVPAFLGFLDQRKVNATQYLIYQALRSTQQDAAQLRQTQQFSLRERAGQLEWASHPATIRPAQVNLWTPLLEGVGLASEDNTLLRQDGAYYVRFNLQGDVKSRLGRITVVGSGSRLTHRCVVISTLIGAMRQGRGHSRPLDGRYCY